MISPGALKFRRKAFFKFSLPSVLVWPRVLSILCIVGNRKTRVEIPPFFEGAPL